MPGPLESFRDAQLCLNALVADDAGVQRLEAAASALAAAFRDGAKVLACGNGGSACDSMHFCEELTGRFRKDRPALPAISLTDPGHLTCVANDFGYDSVFSRGVEALGRRGDWLVCLSTSGNSPSVVKAASVARSRGLIVACLLGRNGGALRGMADYEWIIPGSPGGHADRIQEIHMLILHVLIERTEHHLGLA